MISSNIPFDRVIYQAINYNDNSPPFVPQGIRVTDWTNLIPIVAARLATDIGMQAIQQGIHAGRVLVFNILAANNWGNQYFTDAVGKTFVYLEYLVRCERKDIDNALGEAVVLGSRLAVADAVFNNQNIIPFLPAQVFTGCQATADGFKQVNTSLQQQLIMEQNRSNYTQVTPLNPFSQFNPQQVIQQNNFHQSNQSNQSVYNNNNAMNNRHSYGQNNMSNVIEDARFSAHARAGNNNSQNNNYQPPKAQLTPNTDSLETNSPVPARSSFPTPNTQHVAVDVKKVLAWASSVLQPYRFWCDPFSEKKNHVEEKASDGNTYVVETIVSKSGEEMEQAKHDLPVFGFTRDLPENKGIDKLIALEQARVIIEKHEEAKRIVEEMNQKTNDTASLSVFEIEEFNWVSNIDNLMLTARMKSTIEKQSAVRVWGSVPNIHVFDVSAEGEKDRVETWFECLRQAGNINDVHLVFKTISEYRSVPTDTRSLSNQFFFWRIANDITKEINDILKIQLSVSTTIDSFILDFPSIGAYLSKEFSLATRDKFMLACSDITKRLKERFDGTSEELLSIFDENVDLSDTSSLMLDCFVDNYSVTTLPYTAADLGVHRIDGSVQVAQSTQPAMYKIIQNTFSVSENVNADSFKAHYLLLLCGTRLRLHKGILGQEVYLISN